MTRTQYFVKNTCDDALLSFAALQKVDDWNGCERHHTRIRYRCSVIKKPPLVDPKTAEEFSALAKQWKQDTAIISNLSKIVMHPAYQRIMGMGDKVLPLILREMNERPGHWFWALHNLVPNGQDPAEGVETTKEARDAWLKWGRANNLL